MLSSQYRSDSLALPGILLGAEFDQQLFIIRNCACLARGIAREGNDLTDATVGEGQVYAQLILGGHAPNTLTTQLPGIQSVTRQGALGKGCPTGQEEQD